MSKASLPAYLRTYRKRSGLSQKEVAFLVSLKRGSSVARHEECRRLPSLGNSLAYETLFDVSPSTLFPEESEKARSALKARALLLLESLVRRGKDDALSKHKRLFLLKLIERLGRYHQDE